MALKDRCDQCQQPRQIGYYACAPTERLCLSCHIDAHAPGGAAGLAGACKAGRGPYVRVGSGMIHMIPAALFMRPA